MIFKNDNIYFPRFYKIKTMLTTYIIYIFIQYLRKNKVDDIESRKSRSAHHNHHHRHSRVHAMDQKVGLIWTIMSIIRSSVIKAIIKYY